ncbi:DUF779 domain-containing protein [Paraburkholderia sp. BCC1886]|uniref:DUF779 domain-containing protein n=1 Tax=Paraburkholderia sp. BCC1886 TaxID=2562670 RepID=UPI0011822FCB|nr:DUF779 domain-containing protein [Paraburkholderia sp. BCC1886]
MADEKEVTQAVQRVIATPAAVDLIDKLKAEHGEVLFHQSGGCCDGSAPMMFPQSEFMVGSSDVKLGEIAGVPFYMSESQFEYWQHTQLIIDAVPGNGGMFSLERPSGLRFLTRSRLFEDQENAWLDTHPVERVTA